MARNIIRKKKLNLIKMLTIGICSFSILSVFISLLSLLFGSTDIKIAQAANEPACQTVANSPTWNPYPIQTTFPNPVVTAGNCRDMPMLSFFPVNTAAGNPREKTIIRDETVTFQVYYINGARAGSAAMQNPTMKIDVTKESETRYRIKGTLTSSNSGTTTSAQEGGDLIVNVPQGTRFTYVNNSTIHYPDAIERKEQADQTGRTPYDAIPDNGTGSNPIYTSFGDRNLSSTNGFLIKPQGLEAGFLGYGYVLSQINADVNASPANTPPIIPGEEITVIRGQDGTFKPLAPTDPENDIPISLDFSKLPSNCTVTGTANNTGGGQIIKCTTNASTPSRFEFPITPTDSRGLVGTPGKFIVNIIDPGLGAVKNCYKKGTQTQCKDTQLKAGDQITYEVEATNTSSVPLQNLKIVDTYDRIKLTNITNISDSGQHDTTQGKISWNNLGNLPVGQKKKVTFDATLSQAVVMSDKIVNTAQVSADGIPPKEVKAEFVVGGDLQAIKRCFVKGTQTPCENGNLKAGDQITYQIDVTNSTSSQLSNLRIVDTYDKSKIGSIANITPQGQADENAGTVTWSLGNLAVSESKSVKFDATLLSTVKSGDIITNIAVIQADNIPEKEVDHEFPIAGPGNLQSQKLCYKRGTTISCDKAGLMPNDRITYKVTVKNNSSQTVNNVRIVDTYDKNKLTGITSITPQGQHDSTAGTITWMLGSLAAGQQKEVTFDAVIRDTVPTGTTIVNIAVIKADGIPDQTVRATFPVEFLIPKTPRTGGGVAILFLAFGALLAAGGYYYYKRNEKLSPAFAPARNTESSHTSSRKHLTHHHKKHLKTAHKKAKRD